MSLPTWPALVLIKESTNDSVRRPRLSIVMLAAGSSSVLQTGPTSVAMFASRHREFSGDS